MAFLMGSTVRPTQRCGIALCSAEPHLVLGPHCTTLHLRVFAQAVPRGRTALLPCLLGRLEICLSKLSSDASLEEDASLAPDFY